MTSSATRSPSRRSSRRPGRRQVLLGAGAVAGVGALGGAIYVATTGNAPPLRQHGKTSRAQTERWLTTVRELGRDGDWLAIRGYHPADHLVAGATFRKFSHAAVLDRGGDSIIEAVAPRVRVVDLPEFLANCHRVDLIRPRGATDASGSLAVARARSKLGEPYDFLGTIGLPSERRSYCSELCAWSAQITVDRNGPGHVFHPADMRDHGAVLWESGPRKLSLPGT